MILLYALALYGMVGLVTAAVFVGWGIARVLPQPMPVTVGARILFIPGAAALWPYVLMRWLSARRKR